MILLVLIPWRDRCRLRDHGRHTENMLQIWSTGASASEEFEDVYGTIKHGFLTGYVLHRNMINVHVQETLHNASAPSVQRRTALTEHTGDAKLCLRAFPATTPTSSSHSLNLSLSDSNPPCAPLASEFLWASVQPMIHLLGRRRQASFGVDGCT